MRAITFHGVGDVRAEHVADPKVVDATDVDVRIQNGEVTLTGFVDSRAAKRAAEDCADDVSGVREVYNHLRIRSHADDTGVGRTSVLGLTGARFRERSGTVFGILLTVALSGDRPLREPHVIRHSRCPVDRVRHEDRKDLHGFRQKRCGQSTRRYRKSGRPVGVQSHFPANSGW